MIVGTSDLQGSAIAVIDNSDVQMKSREINRGSQARGSSPNYETIELRRHWDPIDRPRKDEAGG